MVRAISDDDRWLFAEGHHRGLHEILGGHLDGEGATFRVWAPNAAWVAVIGQFNGWDPKSHPMTAVGTGLWEARVDGASHGDAYKYRVTSRQGYGSVDKADPFAVTAETPPATASRLWSIKYEWQDYDWAANRTPHLDSSSAISVYEVHLGSWRNHGSVTYRNIAAPLAEYVFALGFTHVELLPLMEHPFYGSWGYQDTGYFAATSRYGSPEDLMFMIDHLHQRGIGVILDWVPSHFPTDLHGLGMFDGTHLYEHPDPRRGFHPDWSSYIFNYDRPQVQSFLLSSAHFWLDRYHADALRVDAVASMLYLDYSRKEGEWIPNRNGGRENLEAVEFLRKLSSTVNSDFPGAGVIAEESTAWPQVTGPVERGGLGFNYKWDMGWMNDTLRYTRLDPLFRSHPESHRLVTFRGLYAGSERFVLTLSHDEVVHGKRSLLGKQWGDGWEQFAGLRALFGYMWATPGKKLLFMGGEFGQWKEWNHDADLDWDLLDYEPHRQVHEWVGTLNRIYREEPAFHLGDDGDGFRWIEADDYARAAFAFLRLAPDARSILVLLNFTPVEWRDYRVGVPRAGPWEVLASSDDPKYGGTGEGVRGAVQATPGHQQGFEHWLSLTLPPLSAVFMYPTSEVSTMNEEPR
ncbi:MAG: 1,4-alpha-glucan branching protein GlgB [Acidimicrobiia bacterium]